MWKTEPGGGKRTCKGGRAKRSARREGAEQMELGAKAGSGVDFSNKTEDFSHHGDS